MAKRRPLPDKAAEWDEETRALARELMDVGDAWQRNLAEKAELSRRRTEIYMALDGKVTHLMIAELAQSTKGAVDILIAETRKASA